MMIFWLAVEVERQEGTRRDALGDVTACGSIAPARGTSLLSLSTLHNYIPSCVSESLHSQDIQLSLMFGFICSLDLDVKVVEQTPDHGLLASLPTLLHSNFESIQTQHSGF